MERLIIAVLCLLFVSCKSLPFPEVSTTQTEIAVTGATLQGSIETVKEITDKAKTTGKIDDVQTVIKYVDKSAGEVKTLNALITKQTGEIAEQSRVITVLRNDVAKYKPYQALFFILSGIILIIIVLLRYRILNSRKP